MKYTFKNLSKAPSKGAAVYFARQNNQKEAVLDAQGKLADAATDGQLSRAIEAADFNAAAASTLELMAPHGLKLDAIIIVGLGKIFDLTEDTLTDIGANAFGAAQKISERVNFVVGHESIEVDPHSDGRSFTWL